MRSMCAQRKHHLQQQFMRIDITCIVGETVLSTDLTELARPVGQHCRSSLVREIREFTSRGAVKSPAHKPAPSHLIIARSVEAERTLLTRDLLPLAPYEFAAPHKRMINRSSQRPPPQGGVNPIQVRQKVRSLIVMPSRIRETEIKIRGFGQVAVAAQVQHRAHIIFIRSHKNRTLRITRIAPE